MAWVWKSTRDAHSVPRAIELIDEALDRLQRALYTPEPLVVLPYSASMTPDMARAVWRTFQVTATNGTAFALNAPLHAQVGAHLTLDLLNSSGGALGVATINAAYKLAGAWVNPANGKRRTYTFYVATPSLLIEISRAAADI